MASLQGTMSVTSRVGSGTRVTVSLPLVLPDRRPSRRLRGFARRARGLCQSRVDG